MRRGALLLVLSSLSVCVFACRKELTYDYKGIPVHISIDWCEAAVKPEGMRVIFYPLDRDVDPVVDNINPDGATINLFPGRYAVVMFNNDSETILIRGEESFETIEAYTRTIAVVGDNASSSQGNSGGLLGTRADAASIPVVNAPDKLFAVTVAELNVTNDAITRSGELPLDVTPKTLVSQYCISHTLTGGEYVQGVRGGIYGLASSVMLGKQETVTTPNYVPTICSSRASNVVNTTFTTFGVPVGGTGPLAAVQTVLELSLPSGAPQITQIDITKTLAITSPSDPTAPVPTPTPSENNIVVVYDPGGGGGGFNPDIGDWGDVEIPLPLKSKPATQTSSQKRNVSP